jgi:peptidoglycan/xylan/chitin deacetylase (PgdA/CDA1 family)
MPQLVHDIREGWRKTWPGISCAMRGGLPEFILSQRPGPAAALGDGVPVFCYHTVDKQIFADDLDFLAHNRYVTITADELADHMEGVRRAPRRSVVITFDDGPANLYKTAFPLLRDFGFTAVAFVAPRFHDLASANCMPKRFCTWDELREAAQTGCIDVQSHTLEHRYVPRWPEPVEIAGVCSTAQGMRGPAVSMMEDFAMAKALIENRLGTIVRHLAFPRFQGTVEGVEIGRAVGYRAFWWGGLAGRPLNRPGEPATHIVRLSGHFLRRLPGRGRVSLGEILRWRCAAGLRQLRRVVSGGNGEREGHR